jgi:thimet oligopeptidase
MLVTIGSLGWFARSFTRVMDKREIIETFDDVVALFPKTVQDIEQRAEAACKLAEKEVRDIVSSSPSHRTFANTFGALDDTMARFKKVLKAISMLEMVSIDEEIRASAHNANIRLTNFGLDCFLHNAELYAVCKDYSDKVRRDSLHDEEIFYLDKIIKDFEYAGLHLSPEHQAKITELKKALTPLEVEFEANINSDQGCLIVERAELSGLDDAFIAGLARTDDGSYILKTDYPIFIPIMENCTVESTRRGLWKLFVNRAYPRNSIVLRQIIELRNECARLLGFQSYAHFNLDDLMAKNPETVDHFLDNIIVRSLPKVKQEFDLLTSNLPDGVSLTEDGKIRPWDNAFIKEMYKKKHLAVDERHIAEYFPLEHTLEQLLSIYEQFMGISFKSLPASGLWHEEVKALAVYNKTDTELLGYILLDLFPRPHKYKHACEIDIVKAGRIEGVRYPAVAVVLTNFPRALDGQPSLLQRSFVTTFFHEFGHALHEILGATRFSELAGTSVKLDFVEMPSQMLEEWLWDEEILIKVSKHYITNESLPHDIIERIRALKYFDIGDWLQRQAFLAKLSLYYFKQPSKKSLCDMYQELYQEIRTHVVFEHDDHFEASFSHLVNYGAGYYSYLWSKVYASDAFSVIKPAGLLNSVMGGRYVDEILSKGGSVPPQLLLRNFLGRDANSDAFFADVGLSN